MRHLAVTLVALWLAASMLPADAQEVVDIEDLDMRPLNHQGEVVTITGELIGDYGVRGDVVWVQLNDDPYVTQPLAESAQLAGTNAGIGIRMPSALFDDGWGSPGRYRIRGPIVEVTGVFRYRDPQTGGDTFIDATHIRLIEASRPLAAAPVDPAILGTGLVLFLFGAGSYVYVHWWRARLR